MPDGSIVAGSERLYYALALAAKYASEDSEWEYVRDRLDELTRKYERLQVISVATGWPKPRELENMVKSLVDAVSSRSLRDAARTIMALDEVVESALPVFHALYRYISTVRISAALVEILAGLALLLVGSAYVSLILSLTLTAAGVAAGLLYRLPYSDVMLAFGGAVAVLMIVHSPPSVVVFTSSLSAVIAALAAAPLARFLSGKVANIGL